ncbi:MAG: DUF1592 domain-containing protein [Pirellulales bacterium]
MGPACVEATHDSFVAGVWTKVLAQSCLTCHKAGGDAEESEFVLLDPSRVLGEERKNVLERNAKRFLELAKRNDADGSIVLRKVLGELDHGGKAVLSKDSVAYRVLADAVRRANGGDAVVPSASPRPNAQPFFAGVTMLDDRRLLRRVSLSLAGRLPTAAEYARLERDGSAVLPALLDELMREEAFYTRLREAFNDIFLTRGYGDGAESALAYEHFNKSRLWTQNYDLSSAGDEKAQRQARYKLSDDYRAAILGEPMKLIEHIVRNDRPFTEIVTADYIMVTPYTARGYGIFDDVAPLFQNTNDPFEYVPVRLKALVGRDRKDDQPSETGFYPHAGMLGMFQYLRRYPTTETNRNRLRARMYFNHFLGIDALELAARVSDAATVTAKFETPTMQASECVVCHKTIDPIAGLFQDYYRFEGVYGRRKDGWYKDMFQAGFEDETLPPEEKWRALQWLGEKTAADPRFAVAMVEHAYYLLTGRKTLLPPKDLEEATYDAKLRAYHEQRRVIEEIALRFSRNHFDFKQALKDLIATEFYRADGVAASIIDPARRAELDDVGVTRMLSPEQLERKIFAVFGRRWGRLMDQTAMLYGGIDSNEVTERAADPSGAMGAIQRTMANDVAAKNVLRDFALPSEERLLFPRIEPTTLPGESAEGDATIRDSLVHLHERILGHQVAVDSPEIEADFRLFTALVEEAKQRKGLEKQEIYHVRNGIPNAPPDPHYTIRACAP